MKYIYNASKSKNQFTKAMKDYVEKRFANVEKSLKQDEPIKLSLEMVSKSDKPLILKCQMVTVDNKHIRAEASSNDFYLAVDELKNKANGLIRKHKNKKVTSKAVDILREHIIENSEIAKTKQVVLESISVEKAIKEAEELGHAWFVFKNSEENDAVCIVYKRFEGDFGLMICK